MNPNEISKVHVVFKTHLDLGFTDLAANVLETYRNYYFPKAYRVAEVLAQSDREEKFVWTTGAWLIDWMLETGTTQQRQALEQAILNGVLVWNAMPFTPHSELMDASLFRHGLGISKALDRRFEKTTIAAKITDLPGQTRAVVPLLAEAGIKFLHVGVNSGSALPDVPPVFVWRDPNGAEVVTAYHHYYGGVCVVEGLNEALALEFTRDNLGPHSIEEVILTYRRLRERFPKAQIVASSLDAFAVKLLEVKSSLPVLTDEIGDTWVHGVGSDPQKVAGFRELSRLRRHWLEQRRIDPKQLHGFSNSLSLVTEHTWGMDEKAHLGDSSRYEAATFAEGRSRANFQSYESSWAEQRQYLNAAVESLEPSLKAEAEQCLAQIRPEQPDLSEYEPVPNLSALLETPLFDLAFGDDGSLVHLKLKKSDQVFADPTHRLASFGFEVFLAQDYEQFFREYTPKEFQDEWWVEEDFGKPGLDKLHLEHQRFLPHLARLFRRDQPNETRLLAELAVSPVVIEQFGYPQRVWLEVVLAHQRPEIQFSLSWFGKAASRIPQAFWLSFTTMVAKPEAWRLEKLGQWISPLEVVSGGNRTLHAIGSGVRYQDGDLRLDLESLDAALVAPGQPALLRFENQPSELEGGMHFNLYNNVWGTNFPAWNEGDMRFRFRLSIEVKPKPNTEKNSGCRAANEGGVFP